MTDTSVERIRYLREAKPTTEFERVAESINVDIVSHNGGIHYHVTLFDVLKYPTAYQLDTLKVLPHDLEVTYGPIWRG